MNTLSIAKDVLDVLQKHGVTAATFDSFKGILQQVLTFLETLYVSGTAQLKIDEKEAVNFFGNTYAFEEALTVTGTKT